MERFIFNNGLKLVYEYTSSNLTSVSIALEAGASVEGKLLGVAHATEHMVYKGTKNRSEKEINKEISRVFGFSNAMTNYPYCIYYGSLLPEDFKYGLELFQDILINPLFSNEGFVEEMNCIKEELKEWDEELDQYCEDKLLINSFRENRLKYPIIGTMKDLDKIRLEDIKNFYKKYYSPKNAVISVVSSLSFEKVKEEVFNGFKKWQGEEVKVIPSNETPVAGEFLDFKEGVISSRVEIISSLKDLTLKEKVAFKIFNEFFGEGINSVLFTLLRTETGLVYDVLTSVSQEKHIDLYKIMFTTCEEKQEEALSIVKEALSNINRYKGSFSNENINKLLKTMKLRKLFKEEQTVRLANRISTEELMGKKNEISYEEGFSEEEILNVASKVLSKTSIQVIKGKRGKNE